MLRVLDADAAGEKLNPEDSVLLRDAQAMSLVGYLDILRLADASAETETR